MSSSVIASLQGDNVKFPVSLKNTGAAKTSQSIVQSPVLLLTVQYPQYASNEAKKSVDLENAISSFNTQQPSLVQKNETAPYSLVHLNQSVMKSIVYYGVNKHSQPHLKSIPDNDLLNPKHDVDVNEDYLENVDSSQNGLSNNFVVTPVPKSVVCTVMSKDNKVSKHVPLLEATHNKKCCLDQDSEGIKLGGFGDFSSDEEDAIQIIVDKPVTCRAVASLPAKFLYFKNVDKLSVECKGVFAMREISKRAQFGPMEGLLKENTDAPDHFLKLSIETNGDFERLDVSNENTSNWMRYVRQATLAEEQNLCLHQIGKSLYFIASRKIEPDEELKVWYSVTYAKARNLPLLCQVKSGKLKRSNVYNMSLSEKEKSVSDTNSNKRKESEWQCSHCQKVFRSATPFNLHVLTHAADNLETKDNNRKVSSSSSCVKSDVCDIKNRPFVCYKCKKTFLSNSALACHVKSHASVKTFDCPVCKKIFNKVLHLKQHIKNHEVEGSFFCPYCSKKYKEYRHIRNHIRRFHCEKNFGCVKCSKHFSTIDKLKLHMLSHSDHREFSCATCGKQFKRKDKLSVHMKRIHLSPPVLLSTENSCSLRNEKKVSTQKDVCEADYSEYVYKCHACMLGFKRRGMLVNHLANRHPEVTPDSVPELNLPILKANKDYYCQYCDKIYKSSSKRKAHILKNHPGEKLPLNNRQMTSLKDRADNGTYSETIGSVTTYPQNCDWCHKQYASKAKLLQHQRKKHFNLLPKSLQHPKKSSSMSTEEDTDTIRDVIDKVIETDIFLPDAIDIPEYETMPLDSKYFSGGELIIDATTLKRAIKGEVVSSDCSPETLSELGQIIDSRPDGYFKVYQASSGITLAHPVEVWDPFQLCLSPSFETAPILSS